MQPWDVYTWEFPGAGPHPAVILGTDMRLANKPQVNILFCSSKRATRKADSLEIMLDEADGLDWETLCKCDLIFTAAKEELTHKRGSVTRERRRQIAERVIRGLGLAGL